MGARDVGMMLVGLGVIAILAGLLIGTGAFNWFGRLPGDIRIENDNTRVYIPITSMLVVSAALTLIANIVRKFF